MTDKASRQWSYDDFGPGFDGERSDAAEVAEAAAALKAEVGAVFDSPDVRAEIERSFRSVFIPELPNPELRRSVFANDIVNWQVRMGSTLMVAAAVISILRNAELEGRALTNAANVADMLKAEAGAAFDAPKVRAIIEREFWPVIIDDRRYQFADDAANWKVRMSSTLTTSAEAIVKLLRRTSEKTDD